MSKEADASTGLVVIEEEQMRDEGKVIGAWGQSSPVMNQLPVMMTADKFTEGSIPVKEVRDKRHRPMEDPISSLLVSFQLLHSSQSSEKDKMIPYTPNRRD